MDFTNGMKKAFLASVGAAATTAEVTKDILEKMIEKGERTVEHGKVLNQELKHNAKQKVKEHVSIQVTKKYDKAFECVDEMSPEDLALLKERIAKAEALQKENRKLKKMLKWKKVKQQQIQRHHKYKRMKLNNKRYL